MIYFGNSGVAGTDQKVIVGFCLFSKKLRKWLYIHYRLAMSSCFVFIERLLVEVKPNQQRIYVGGEKYSFFKIIFCGSGKAFTINDLQKKNFDEMQKYLEEGTKNRV